MKKVAGMIIGVALAVLVITAINLKNDVKAEFPQDDVVACDRAADGTAYVIEGNEIVGSYTTEECEK